MDLFLECYGKEPLRPKHHYALHIGSQCRRDGMLLDCFVLERKHISIKKFCNHCDNGQGAHFERNVLTRHFVERHNMEANPFENMLLGSATESRELATAFSASNVHIADGMRYEALKVFADEIVFFNDSACEILSCMQVDGQFELLVKLYNSSGIKGHGRTWKPSQTIARLKMVSKMSAPSFWSFSQGELLTLGG